MNKVRIVGGKWRGRLLAFPDHEGLRPTPDRVRETLFNWLGQDLTGLSCLDLFAGSGALGFEASSRGAARVVMIDNNRSVVSSLKNNRQMLQADSAMEIVEADAVKFVTSLSLTETRFDVIFADPPYRKGWLDKLETGLSQLLDQEGSLYIESEKKLDHYGPWHAVRHGRAGQVYYQLMQREQ